METPGKYLKKERQLRNISLKEVSRAIRIGERYLWAIEEDRYDLLPPPIYVKGFLTAYARYLGLNPNEINKIYKDYLKTAELSPADKSEPKTIHKRARRLFIPVLLIIIVILAFVFWLWNFFENSHKFREVKKPAPKDLPLEPSVPVQEKEELKENLGKKELSNNNSTETQKPTFEVLEAYTGSGISEEGGKNILVGKTSEFICNNQKVYFFTRIKTDKEVKVSHIWLFKDKEFHRIEMDVKPPVWSTYSYITLRGNLAGPWRVEVRWGNEILKSLNFYAYETH